MSEQQKANYVLTIEADSGYSSTTEGRCTADQYGQAIAALHGESAQHTWVGLTPDERETVLRGIKVISFDEYAIAIEAALKEKNT